jgi:TAT (twin-arginine translocation) pathway signal sequence
MSAIFTIEEPKPAALGRRSFLKGTAAAAAGLTIGFYWAGPTRRALAATAGAFCPECLPTRGG